MLTLPAIGATIIYNGCAYRFCGTTPTSVQPTMALLQDLRTGVWSEIPAIELSARPRRPRSHGGDLRVNRGDDRRVATAPTDERPADSREPRNSR